MVDRFLQLVYDQIPFSSFTHDQRKAWGCLSAAPGTADGRRRGWKRTRTWSWTRGGTDRENECPGMGHGARTKNWSRHLHRSRAGSKVSRSIFFFFFRIRQRVPMRTGLLINRRNRRGGMEEGRGRAWSSSVAIFYKADGRNKLKIKSTERRRSGVATSR